MSLEAPGCIIFSLLAFGKTAEMEGEFMEASY